MKYTKYLALVSTLILLTSCTSPVSTEPDPREDKPKIEEPAPCFWDDPCHGDTAVQPVE